MILMYHKVALETPTMWWVSADAFYRQMAELRNRKVVYLDDYNPADPAHVCLTFDGVYDNVHKFAAPILEHFGYPYELFVVSEGIGAQNGFDPEEPAARFASRDQLAEMVRRGARLQWHTRTHRRLTDDLPLNQLRSELRVPKTLQALDPAGFRWIAYPHGDFTPRTLQEAARLFAGGVSCDQGNGMDPLQRNRVTVTEESRFGGRSIAVVIPCYNYGRFLGEATESVLRQTIRPDQILIIDDASSDETAVIGSALQQTHGELITFVQNKTNRGIVPTFNKAIELVDADYVVFLGADNRFLANYLERCAEVLDRDESVGVAYTDFALFGARAPVVHGQFPEGMRGENVNDTFWLVHFPGDAEHVIRTMAAGEQNLIHGSSMFRRQAWIDAGGYRKFAEYPEDFDLFRRILSAGWKPQKAAGTLLEYRHHSSEQANARLQSSTNLRVMQETVERLQQQLEERTRQLEEKTTHALHFERAFEEKAKHVQLLQEEVREKTGQVFHFQRDFEERSRHVSILQRELDRALEQINQQTRAFDEKVRHVELLQRDLDEKSRQVAHFKSESDQRARSLEQLNFQLQLADDRLSRLANELVEARWQALTVRATALQDGGAAAENTGRVLELENRAQVAESECDHLRGMLKTVQIELEQQQAVRHAKEAQLKSAAKELRFQQKQMARLKQLVSRRLILPFGKAQRKIEQLTAAIGSDD